MRIVIWLVGIVVALAAALFFGGMLLSPNFTVQRSLTVQASPDKVYAIVASPRRWKEWTVWNQRDPAMAIDYFGPETGAGAGWAWKSKSQGDGKMTFTAAEENRRIAYDLYFPDFGTTSGGVLEIAPDGAGSKITWVMNGNMGSNPIFRWMTLMSDSMVGKDFEAGLANLKTLAEKP